MRTFSLIVMSLLLLTAQALIAGRISIGEIAPDFVLLVIFFLGLYTGTMAGALLGFAVGFLQDLGNPEFLGLNAMLGAILGFLLGRAGQKTFPENTIFMFALFATAAFGHDIAYLIVYMWPNLGAAFATIFVNALPSAIYTAVIGVIVHRIASRYGTRVVTLGKERQY